MHAAGVNPVDTYIRAGKHNRRPTLPYTPGSDGAGIITKLGKNITDFKVNDGNKRKADKTLFISPVGFIF